jgi:hypothetical protein
MRDESDPPSYETTAWQASEGTGKSDCQRWIERSAARWQEVAAEPRCLSSSTARHGVARPRRRRERPIHPEIRRRRSAVGDMDATDRVPPGMDVAKSFKKLKIHSTTLRSAQDKLCVGPLTREIPFASASRLTHPMSLDSSRLRSTPFRAGSK